MDSSNSLLLSQEGLTPELLKAADSCGRSLQKSLALPGIGSLYADLAVRLLNQNWRPSRYTRFAVEEPKLREIFAPAFADRVVESWLIGWLEPALERCSIDDSYANRKGKGPLAAIRKAQKLMRAPGHLWALQLDMRSFFHSIHRPTLLALWLAFLSQARLERKRLKLAVWISRAILEHSPVSQFQTVAVSRPLLALIPAHKSLLGAPPETGLPIGSVASQHFANFYLNGLDHFIKHELRVRGYVRYMDDLLLLGQDPVTLRKWQEAIAAYLSGLRLTLHPAKIQLGRAAQGVEYLGYRVYPHHLHVCSRTVKTFKARLDFFKHLFDPLSFPKCQRPVRGTWPGFLDERGLTPPLRPTWPLLKKMEATLNSYLGLMGQAESYRLRQGLYDGHFGLLRRFFIPTNPGYASVHIRKRFLYH